MSLDIKKHKQNFEVNLRDYRKSYYRNIIDRDPNKLAQILIDLFIFGFPIEKAIKLFNERIKKKDWLGF